MPAARGRPRTYVAPCKFCHKQFKRMEHLQRHERIHTHEKPYGCQCGQRFTRRDLLRRHQRQARHARAPDKDDCPTLPEALENVIQEEDSQFETHNTSNEPNKIPRGQNEERPGVSGEHAIGPSRDSESIHDHNEANVHEDSRGESAKSTDGSILLATASLLPVSIQSHNQQDSDEVVSSESCLNTYAAPAALATSSLTPTTFEVPAVSDFLFGTSPSIDQFEFLWNEFPTNHQPLPSQFLNTDLTLVDLSEQYAILPPTNYNAVDLPINSLQVGKTDGIGLSQGLVEAVTQPQTLASRLPSLEPEARVSQHLHNGQDLGSLHSSNREHGAFVCPWRVSVGDYQSMVEELTTFAGIMPKSFSFPSRHTLVRYLEGYFRGFHAHMPFLHTRTTKPVTLGLELVLSLAYVGALYRFEHAAGIRLYLAARCLINWRLGKIREGTVSGLSAMSPSYVGFSNGSPGHSLSPCMAPQGREGLRLLQSLLVLMAITSWGDKALVPDALSMASQVAMLVREFGISVPENRTNRETSWEEWIRREEKRRTLLVCYIMLNLQCIAFEIPPMILNQEIRLDLPGPAAEWGAQTAEEWSRACNLIPWSPQSFQDAIRQLRQGLPAQKDGAISAFGNYVLIHGLFQQIFLARNAAGCTADFATALDGAFVKNMETSLIMWQASWEATNESTLDPSSPKGPLGFNSTALLRLSYIRLNANTGPIRQLITRDPNEIALGFDSGNIGVSERSPHLDRAILQCIHALSVPVRVGIAFVARTQTLNWSFQHSLANLECAFLLAHWLRAIAADVESMGIQSIRPDEQKLLDMLVALIRETDFVDSLNSLQNHADGIRRLAVLTTRLWAETFKGFQVLEIVYVIGAALSIVADDLEKSLGDYQL